MNNCTYFKLTKTRIFPMAENEQPCYLTETNSLALKEMLCCTRVKKSHTAVEDIEN